MKRVLVTAGATVVPIDKVRAITNIFRGRTGTYIADYLAQQGLEVTLLTSSPELTQPKDNLAICRYRTFWELLEGMQQHVTGQAGPIPDVVIHSAAVSDYEVAGVCYQNESGELVEIDNSGKMSSDHTELYLRMTPTPKIVDLIRKPWGFQGTLVKFKLQVGITDQELLEIATRSMHHSRADYIVANCLEWSGERAHIISAENDSAESVCRQQLPEALYRRIA